MPPAISARARRRIGWALGVLVVVTGLVLAVVLLPRGRPLPSTALRPDDTSTTPERPFAVTPAIRRELDDVVQRFVRSAVLRKDLDTAWELASAKLKAGVTHERWSAGELPVFPFPEQAFRAASWRKRLTYGRTAAIDVMVVPKPGSSQRTIVYGAELTDYGAPGHRRWLVDTWYPQTTLGGGAPAPQTTQPAGPATTAESPLAKGKLDARWLLVPLGVLVAVALVPLFLLARGAVRRRRAARRYREHRG